MRKFPFLVALLLAGCGGNGDGFELVTEPVQHASQISNLTLSPDNALYMEGDGSVQVTAELSFNDLGQDIETLHVKMSDGTSLVVPISDSVDAVSGTLTAAFDVTTADADGCTVEIWLVDQANQSSNHLSAAFAVIRHAPEISNVNLSPDSALYMEGDGSVIVSAEITVRDNGRDIQTLWIRMPDGISIEFDELIATETGTFTEDFTMSTETVGAFAVEFWLVDKAGDSSDHVTAVFIVGNVQGSDWTKRLSVPYPLYDVVWDGQVFIAVGYGGTILTSVDGIDWVARDSTTEDALYAVAAYGSDIFAVGGFIVLLSTDRGETWSAKARPDYIALTAVAVNSSQVVALGVVPDLLFPKAMLSEDRGETWRTSDFSWAATDLIFQDGLFVAAAMPFIDGSSVTISSDGKLWNGTLVREEYTRLDTVVHDGSQFIVAGANGTVFTSLDALNWTEIPTPFDDVDYWSAAWNGSLLMLAGRMSQYWLDGTYRPIGISSSDGGATWETFDIDTDYQSMGMAWGNGRFVSVGWTADSDAGAIYTTE